MKILGRKINNTLRNEISRDYFTLDGEDFVEIRLITSETVLALKKLINNSVMRTEDLTIAKIITFKRFYDEENLQVIWKKDNFESMEMDESVTKTLILHDHLDGENASYFLKHQNLFGFHVMEKNGMNEDAFNDKNYFWYPNLNLFRINTKKTNFETLDSFSVNKFAQFNQVPLEVQIKLHKVSQ